MGSQLPGVGTTKTATPRQILATMAGVLTLPGGKIIAGASARDHKNTGDLDTLRAGILLGKITASGKYAPSVLGLVTEDTSAASPNVKVEESAGDELERRVGASGNLKLIGAPTDTGTVAISADLAYNSIGAAAGGVRTIVLAANCPAVYVDGSFLCAADGSHLPKTVVIKETGIKVTDRDNVNIDVELAQFLLCGILKATQIINYPAAALTTLRAWVKAQLQGDGRHILFDDDY